MIFKVPIMAILCLFLNYNEKEDPRYHKEFYENGKTKGEGWLLNNTKTGYWKFYHKNGTLSEQGHYKDDKRENYWYFYSKYNVRVREGNYDDGQMINWWLFYNKKGTIAHKCQLKYGKKNGYCLKYENEKITAAVQYINGKRIKEWATFSSFKKENKLSDLH
ncbi:hypothetical protein [Maribacter sp.]|uniref:toxin-antitoxin system YwqK family antitoxin n=1 Tax=Maribacter sp. TaxID=1897614 RepID=UPI0025C3CD74|nr:hypothetical protein [Maribacter sp.]